MKKDKIKYSVMLVAACVMLSGLYAYAQDAVTEALVEFTKGVGPTNPVHPEDPSVEENGPGEDGSFLILRVSDFDFGSAEVSATEQWYPVTATMPNIQVLDLRGSGAGWRVSASVSRFSQFNSETEEYVPSLPGASIGIAQGRPNSLSVSPPPVQKPNLNLSADGASFLVMTADVGAGIGLWVMRWYPPTTGVNVHLKIPPGSATLGSHTAKINWVLEDGPSE